MPELVAALPLESSQVIKKNMYRMHPRNPCTTIVNNNSYTMLVRPPQASYELFFTSRKLAGDQNKSLQSGASNRKGRSLVNRLTQFNTGHMHSFEPGCQQMHPSYLPILCSFSPVHAVAAAEVILSTTCSTHNCQPQPTHPPLSLPLTHPSYLPTLKHRAVRFPDALSRSVRIS